MQDIRAAQQRYKSTKGVGKYGSLRELVEADLLKSSLSNGEESGYRFAIRTSDMGYVATAVPLKYGVGGTGFFSYYVDETGTIRAADKNGEEAGKDAPPISEKGD